MVCHVMTSCISRHLIAIRTKYVPGAVRVAKKHYTWRKGVYVHAFTIDKLFTQPASHHGLLSATRETPSGWRFAGGSIVARFNELIKKLLIRLMRFRFYSIILLFLFMYMHKANMQISLHVCTV